MRIIFTECFYILYIFYCFCAETFMKNIHTKIQSLSHFPSFFLGPADFFELFSGPLWGMYVCSTIYIYVPRAISSNWSISRQFHSVVTLSTSTSVFVQTFFISKTTASAFVCLAAAATKGGTEQIWGRV